MVWPAAILALGLFAASGLPDAPAPQVAETASRVVVKVDERRVLSTPGVDAALVVEEAVAKVNTVPGGLEIHGRRSGETLAQLYGPTGVRVLVVVVEPPTVRPSVPSARSPLSFSRQEPLRSFWGANSYTLDAQHSSTLGLLTNHSLRFSGLVRGGEYNSDLQATAGALGTALLRARLGWRNAKKDAGFELGDSSAPFYGSRLSSSVQLRGLKVRRGNDRLSQELYLGSMTGGSLGYAAGGDQPVVGLNVEGASRPEEGQGLSVRHATSAVAFKTNEGLGDGGRVGLMAGERLLIEHKRGISFEARTATVASSPRADGQPTQTGFEGGVTCAYQQGDKRSASLGYDLNVGRFYLPMSRSSAIASHQLSASYAQMLSPKLHAFSYGSYALVGDSPGEDGRALSYSLGVQALVSAKSRVTLQGGQSSTLFPITTSDGVQISSQTQRTAFLTGLHQFDTESIAQLQLGYENNASPRGSRDAAVGNVAFSRQVAGRWEAGASGGLTAYQDSVIAVDRPPLTVQSNVAARGRFIVGNLESFGGLNLQKTVIGPGSDEGPGLSVNLGVQFAPTLAHRISTTFSLTRLIGTDRLIHSAAMSYTYRFGDSIRADPLFEFMTHGEIEGRVCIDEDLNGQCSARESPIAGITVRLSNGATTVTDAKGHYRFRGLKPGFYSVEADETRLRSLGRLTTPSTASIELASKGMAEAMFGISQGCELKGRVIHDLDLDGRFTAVDSLQGGVSVTASGPDGRFDGAVDSFGTFVIQLRKCGEYTVELNPGSLPPAMRVMSASVSAVTTPNNAPVIELMVAAIRTAEGSVFLDANRNGRKDPGETGVPNARVLWGQGKGATDEAGSFLLRRLPAGKITVTVDPESLPAGLVPAARADFEMPDGPHAVEGVELPVVPKPPPAM